MVHCDHVPQFPFRVTLVTQDRYQYSALLVALLGPLFGFGIGIGTRLASLALARALRIETGMALPQVLWSEFM